MVWKCPSCSEIGNRKNDVKCNCSASPINQNPKQKIPKIKKEKDLMLFCLGCNTDIRTDNDKEWHVDLHGIYNIVQRPDTKQKTIKEEIDTRTDSKKIYDYATSKIDKLVISENNTDEVYALIKVNNHVETLHLASKRARQWLRFTYNESIESNTVHSEDTYKNVLEQISAKAQMNGTVRDRIHTRIAQTKDEFWYDLGTPDWKAIKITKAGIKTVSLDMKSPIFRRSQSVAPQVMPVATKEDDLSKDTLDELIELLLIKKDHRTVFKIHLISLFLENYPIPMIVFDGTAGTAKTTLTASIKKIVDPNGIKKEDNVTAMSEKNEDLINQIYNRYLTAFDNVGYFKESKSDIFCRTITGASNPKRKLYTDEEEIIHSFMRKIVLNGVVPSLEYPDLQTRIISYQREEITENNRLTEQDYWDKFDKLLPKVLGKIFITISKAMKNYENVAPLLKPKTRMADFEKWGEVIARTLGIEKNQFGKLLEQKIKENQTSSQDSYPIIGCILNLMETHNMVEDTATNIFKKLTAIAVNEFEIDIKSKYIKFPTYPNRMVKDMIVIDGILRSNGVKHLVYHYNKRDGRFPRNSSIVRFEKTENNRKLEPFFETDASNDKDKGKDQNDTSLSKNGISRHEKTTDRDGRDDKDEQEIVKSQRVDDDSKINISNITHWECLSCGTGLRGVDESSTSSGNILRVHEKSGKCTIKKYTQSEVKQKEIG